MRSVLVPLDGTELAASILPDAKRLAGPGGRLILIRDLTQTLFDYSVTMEAERDAMQAAQDYLDVEARRLRAEGFQVEVETMSIRDPAMAIDEAVRIFHADAVACATHGRSLPGRLVRGGIAWRAMAQSPVPVLLRHGNGEAFEEHLNRERKIMVPLDGSELAEKAVPLARALAGEWQASISLVQVLRIVPDMFVAEDIERTRGYLEEVSRTFACPVTSHVLTGTVPLALASYAQDQGITDVVMASHGRTGLSRAILGSVTDALLQHVHIPIVVVPSLAERVTQSVVEQRVTEKVPLTLAR